MFRTVNTAKHPLKFAIFSHTHAETPKFYVCDNKCFRLAYTPKSMSFSRSNKVQHQFKLLPSLTILCGFPNALTLVRYRSLFLSTKASLRSAAGPQLSRVTSSTSSYRNGEKTVLTVIWATSDTPFCVTITVLSAFVALYVKSLAR